MIPIVFDCNVIMAACGWRNEPHLALVALARRRVRAFVTDTISEECRRVAEGMEAENIFPRSPWPVLNWYLETARPVEPAPLGKQRSRDATDDPYLACALAAGAEFIVSRDPDLLVLEKPFGVAIITPRALLHQLAPKL